MCILQDTINQEIFQERFDGLIRKNGLSMADCFFELTQFVDQCCLLLIRQRLFCVRNILRLKMLGIGADPARYSEQGA
jgi:hypothetical protein